MRFRRLIIFVGLMTMLNAWAGPNAFAQDAQTEANESAGYTDRELFGFETMPREILLPKETEKLIREAGFDGVITLLHDDLPVQALNDAYLMALRRPALWREPAFQLLVAECYFYLGVQEPAIQYEYAKPIYESLMKLYPKWENQPLALFRLGVIYDRKGFSVEAQAVFGLLIDWYEDDQFADNARLGLMMSRLRDGDYRQAETIGLQILEESQDAQIRYHGSIGLAIARHWQNRSDEALRDIRQTVKWPEDVVLLEDFELFAFAEIALVNRKNKEARQALMEYLKRYPHGQDRAQAILYLAEEAQRLDQLKEAVLGYRYLAKNYEHTFAGLKSKLHLAKLHLQAYPNQKNDAVEQDLRQVRDQNDYRGLNQQAGLVLADYYLNVGRPFQAIDDVVGVFDDPAELEYAAQALAYIQRAFGEIIATYRDNPMMVATAFTQYRNYLDVPATPRHTYAELGEMLYQNLQPDTLLAIAGENPLGKKFKYLATLFRAKAHMLRGEYAEAKSETAHLLEMLKNSELENAGRLRFQARVVSAYAERETGNLREALRQISLAQTDAPDQRAKGRLEMEAGLILLADYSPGAAAGRLSNAVMALGELTEAEPIRGWQLMVAFSLGEALYQAKRYKESIKAFTSFSEMAPDDERRHLAGLRIVQASRVAGLTLPELEEHDEETVRPKWFWPRTEWEVSDYLTWWDRTSAKFTETPDWENLP